MERTDVGRRLDLRNISIDFAAASAGLCGHPSRQRPGLPATARAPRSLPAAGSPRQPAERAVGVLRG
jgi:hypothetical protein